MFKMDKVDALNQYSEEAVVVNPNKYEGAPTSYKKQVLDPFIERLKGEASPVVLDLAAGNGASSDYLEVHGVKTIRLDISRKKKDANPADRVRAFFDRIPLPNGWVGAVHFKDALAHSPNHKRLFGEVFRILKPGGEFLIIAADEAFPYPYYIINSKKTGNGERFPFSGEREYVERIQYLAKKGMTQDFEFSPPYYPVNHNRLISELKKAGFKISGEGYWTPQASERDWYYERATARMVISAIRPIR